MATIDSKNSAWQRYEPSEALPWNRQRIVHLHRRAAFAATWSQIEVDLADGPTKAIDRLLSGQSRADQAPAGFESMADTIGDAAQASNDAGRLKAWWLYRMLFSPDPLTERLTLLWHNHFATSNRKVEDLVYMREQNEILRKHARGSFGDLLTAVIKHPAMLVWLDANLNRSGHANENLARELMELFTLGLGNFSEADVQSAARALTGWTVTEKRFQFVAARHDSDEITLLDHRGSLSGDQLLELLIANSATARRLAWRLCTMFFGDGVVSNAAIDELALEFQHQRLDINWAVETMLRSQLFFSPQNMRSRVVGPAEFVVGSIQALELGSPPPSTILLADWTARMGHDLFYPPNVGGWPEGRSWLSTRAIIARANFAWTLTNGGLWNATPKPSVTQLIDRYHQAGDLRQAVSWLAELILGESSPEVVDASLRNTGAKETNDKLATALATLLSQPQAQLA